MLDQKRQRKYLILLAITIVSIIGIKLLGSFWLHHFAQVLDDGAVLINASSAGSALFLFATFGAALFCLIKKIEPEWCDQDSTNLWGMVGLYYLATNICFSGTCPLGALALTSIMLLQLLPIVVGARVAALFVRR